MTLRDHLSATALFRAYGPGSSELGTLGTIPYPSEEYTLTATLTGNSMLRLNLCWWYNSILDTMRVKDERYTSDVTTA